MWKTPATWLLSALLFASPAFAAEVNLQVGTAIEKYEVSGVATSFTVAPEGRLFAGLKVSGIENKRVTVSFWKDGKESSKYDLMVPRSPYRTHAPLMVHAGDSGVWTVKVLGPDGALLASSDIQVTVAGR